MVVAQLVSRVTYLPRTGLAVAMATGQRVVDLVGEAEVLVGQAATLVGQAAGLMARLEVLLDLLEQEAVAVRDIVARVDPQPERAAEAVGGVQEVTELAAGTRALAEEQVRRLQRLVDDYEAPLRALAPLVVQAARELHPRHLTGIASLLDTLPGLVDRLEPALSGMAGLAPGIEEVTEKMENVGQVVEGLPGAGLLRRRGQARESED